MEDIKLTYDEGQLADWLDMRLPKATIRKISNEYGLTSAGYLNTVMQAIGKHPFKLLNFQGAGFKRVDEFYKRIVHEPGGPDDKYRAVYCSQYVLQKSREVWMEYGMLAREIRNELKNYTLADEGIVGGLEQEFLTARDGFVALRNNADHEQRIITEIKRLSQAKSRWPSLEPRRRKLSDHQFEMAEPILQANSFAVMTGFPGVGKTYVIANLLDMLSSDVMIAAPTGKAAVRISEQLNKVSTNIDLVSTSTIHKALDYRPINGRWQFAINKHNQLIFDYVIIDETSMADLWLMANLLEAIPTGASVLLVGDPAQLTPVGAGQPFHDMIASKEVPVARLEEVHRNSGSIAMNCARIRNGMPIKPAKKRANKKDNLLFVHASNFESASKRLMDVYDWLDRRGYLFSCDRKIDLVKDVQTITGRNSDRRALNRELRSYHLGATDGYIKGDKVICLKNNVYPTANYSQMYVANGKIGYVAKIRNGKPYADFDGDDLVCISDADNFTFAYAITCHKYQGSEADIIIVVLPPNNDREFWTRNWLHTAISRASDLCVIIGDPKVAESMVRNEDKQLQSFLLDDLVACSFELRKFENAHRPQVH